MNFVTPRIEETAEIIRSIQNSNFESESEDEILKNKKLNAICKIKNMKSGAVITIPILLLDLTKNRRNEEIDENSSDFIQLVTSINEVGIINKPIITIDEESIFPLEGHRRIAALKRMGYETVVCEVKLLEREELNDLTSLVANTARKNWNIIAISKTLSKLYCKSYTQEKLANLIGKDRTTVLRLLKVASWSEDAHKLIIDNLDKVSVRSILNLASKKLTDEEVLNEVKFLCGILQREHHVNNKILRNQSKFHNYIKNKNYTENEVRIIEEALKEFGIL
jgi:ParB family chromosome partitioning protein